MHTKRILEKASNLVNQGWCQHVAARDKDGNEVSPTSKVATQWCLLGAIAAAIEDDPSNNDLEPKDVARTAAFGIPALLCCNVISVVSQSHHGNLLSWNDLPGRTSEQVTWVLKEAATLAETRGL